jgi:hypothetical protein
MRKRDEPARLGVVLYDRVELLDAGLEQTAHRATRGKPPPWPA